MPSKGLEALARMEYPGRVIIMGRDPSGEHNIVAYAITGRSPSSRAIVLVCDDQETVRTQVTDPEQLKWSNRRLLIYSCIRNLPEGLVVGNGAQTNLIVETMQNLTSPGDRPAPVEILRKAFARPYLTGGDGHHGRVDLTSYEPDGPVFTPRISGCLMNGAALSIVKRAPDGAPARRYYQVPLTAGKGKLISTYAGENLDPLPSFEGQPRDVQLKGQTAQDLANAIYDALAPAGLQKDLRVGVAVLWSHVTTQKAQITILNRRDREG
jgi:IMP cyclohydrolase